tara:strand:- start:1112 stop:2002 length:891 start_codon:yes stop_codon:yes gene_type:complete
MMQVLNGSLVALITPMLKNGEVDFISLEKLIDWHIDEGTNGIVSVGTTGESATVNVNEHIKIIEYTVKHVNKRIPVIAGTGANSTSEAIDLTKEAFDLGADFSLIVTPYYNKPTQKGLIEHYLQLADSAAIPQILYNVPSRTACDLLPSTAKVLSDHENIVGIKEAVNEKERIKELIDIGKSKKNFKIFSGDDPTFFDFLKMGGDGVISVAANVIPRSISSICRHVSENNISQAKKLNEDNDNLYELLFVESNPIPVKWIAYKMGLVENSIRLPLTILDEQYQENIISEMLKLEMI